MPTVTKKHEAGQNDKGGMQVAEASITQIEKPVEVKHPKWQDRLLPVMVGLLIVLTLFFFSSTYWQLYYINQSILRMPTIDIQPASGVPLMTSAKTFDDMLKARELEVKSNMEVFIVTQRYHQVNVLIMSGLWVRYLGVITGMILSIVGASFILGKLREPTQKLEGRISAFDLSLRTTSPGIILVVLGVVLMSITLLDKDIYEVSDRSTYLSPINSTSVPAATDAPVDLISPEEIFGTPMP
jgi:hypothetical protein